MAKEEKKSKRQILSSLYMKAVYVLLTGALLAVGVYMLSIAIGDNAVKDTYMTSQECTRRLEEGKYEFKKYVRENSVSSKDTAAVAAWTMDKKYVTVFVYDDNRLKLEAGYWDSDLLPNNYTGTKYESISQNEGDETYFNVKFTDGVYKVQLYEYSEQAMYDAVRVIALIAACVVFAVTLLLYTSHITRGIVKLSRDAEKMGAGDLETPIAALGNDELAQLAREMDHMRASVVQQMENERVAMQANRDLITAISHDIRTPLTTMLGYLDLLDEKQYSSDEERDKYIETVRSKSLQLKDLTDRLFRYFLAFGREDIQPEMEAYDARILMEQMVLERLVELKDTGWRVDVSVDMGEGAVVCVDAQFLKRVIDNVIGNIKKHADQRERVYAWIREEGDKLSIYIANSIPAAPRKVESTKIGLKTCVKLMEQMGGSFCTYIENNRFAAEILIPVTRLDPAE